MQGYCDVYKWTILKRTSPEVKCLHPTSSRREMCTSSVSNVIYHKFSHGAAFYTLNGKNVNVKLELSILLSSYLEVCIVMERVNHYCINTYIFLCMKSRLTTNFVVKNGVRMVVIHNIFCVCVLCPCNIP